MTSMSSISDDIFYETSERSALFEAVAAFGVGQHLVRRPKQVCIEGSAFRHILVGTCIAPEHF